MSQTAEYDVSTDFITFQANASWFPGSQLNAEFNNLATVTDQVRTNLALIQRDDGALANGTVTFNSLSPALQTAGLTPLTSWATGTNYTTTQAVIQGTSLYQCAVNHTSTTFAADLAAGKWTLLANLALLSGVSTVAANLVAAGPVSGAAASPSFRALIGSDMPSPTSTTLGGVQSVAAQTSKWVNSISTGGVPSLLQPVWADLAGTIPATQLPNPSASTLGGVESITAVTHNFLTSISTSGVPAQAQPAFTDVSGNIAVAQIASGTNASNTTFLRGDNTWQPPTATTSQTVKQQKFVADGTYTPSTGLLYAILECVGGAGGGGGIANGGAGSAASAGGGGSGGYSRAIVTAAQVGASKTVTMGTVGSAGSNAGGNGGNGGDTSVGTLCVGKGGTGGTGAQNGAGGAGGVAGTGDLLIPGTTGAQGTLNSIITVVVYTGGNAPSYFGGGGRTRALGASANGNNGGNYGVGGEGGCTFNAGGAATGGTGSAGVVFITEFCNQ